MRERVLAARKSTCSEVVSWMANFFELLWAMDTVNQGHSETTPLATCRGRVKVWGNTSLGSLHSG